MREPALERDGDAVEVTGVDLRRRAQQPADRVGQLSRLVGLAGGVERDSAKLGRQRRGPVAVSLLGGQQLVQGLGGAAVTAVVQHARQQLLDRLLRLEVEAVHLLARQHQP